MKKILFSAVFALSSMGIIANAQISQGGLPWSMVNKPEFNELPVSRSVNPDWSAYLAVEAETNNTTQARPYIGGLIANADFGFPQSGQLQVLPNGSKIWSGVITIDGAPSMGLLFNQFNLPKGVKLFLSNENGKQIAGAFDAGNNDASGKFAVDVIQGGKVFVELNIAPDAILNDIQLHVDGVMVLHRGIEHLSAFMDVQPFDQIDNQFNGSSSVCMINAICPIGTDYLNSRKATVQTILPLSGGYVGLCSGTLVNNTGNAAGNCKAYILSASHCEGSMTLNNAAFNQLMIRFNFERTNCSNTAPTNGVTLTGANLIARSNLISQNVNDIDGDFMLYQLRQAIPVSVGAVLSGWNRGNSLPGTLSSPKKYITFHHPNGDNKKVSASQSIYSDNSVWSLLLTEGYSAPGSSGSGLFDGDGYLIGDLSTGGAYQMPASCRLNAAGEATDAGDFANYQKLWHAWEYSTDGTATNRRLKPWLDPANTGVTKLNSVTAQCATLTTGGGTLDDNPVTVNEVTATLQDQVSVFPNPSSTGVVLVKYNFKTSMDVKLEVVDVTGRKVWETKFNNLKSGSQQIDLSNMNNGIYVIKFIAEGVAVGKKIIINK
ncbi:MAG: T9SS type A sorting domain-containing protein [Sphingobacteriales bacterium]|nr:MAG: T9SS type A sorting domain-containing protein [Sphingobacteriales bacterium]